jgi:hypothetical protein
MAGSWLANKAITKSGIADYAKTKIGGALNHFNQPLGTAWDGVSHATGAISDGTRQAWNGTKNTASRLGHAANDTAGNAWNGAKGLVSHAGHAIGNTAGKAWGAPKSLW